MRKLLLSAAVAMAMGTCVTGAQAGNTILFDMNGAAAGGVISVNTFDWLPDNALAQSAITTGGIVNGTSFNVFAQAKLGSFVMPSNVAVTPSIGEFTFVASFKEQAAGGGGSAGLVALPGGTVTIYFDPTANSNQRAGTGYNDGIPILTGTIVSGTGAFVDFTRQLPAFFPNTNLDNFGANNYPGVTTHQGNGSNTLNIDVTFADPTFFLSNIASLAIDANDTGNLTAPFNQADPAALIAGQAPVRGTGNVNGGDCPGRCDFQFQTDDSTTFTSVPEPASLALVSLGLLSVGGFARKRVK